MKYQKNILMVAAENDALPNAKVGGIGDVVRDIPIALSRENCTIQVVLPDYGYFSKIPSTQKIAAYQVNFGGQLEEVHLFKVQGKQLLQAYLKEAGPAITYWALGHSYFSPCGDGAVYCNDGSERPFATDANKYAFFCAAVAQVCKEGGFGALDVIHLHDWHAALILVLREYDPAFSALKKIPTVYTIHNLSLQGVRPFIGDESAFETWYPHLKYDRSRICDPRTPHCINPMRAGINLADKVHTVSPSYAQEIQRPSYPERGIFGGDGLEQDLIQAQAQGKLIGILNGCEYPEDKKYKIENKTALANIIIESLIGWVSKNPVVASCHWVAQKRMHLWQQNKERGFIVTSVGRITEQKVRLLKEIVDKSTAETLLDAILNRLGNQGAFFLLGSGETEYEQYFLSVSARHPNFIYLQGYSDALSHAMYNNGDLFLMPSSFEPCGISQMLAMRAGQPCLVHAVGGLNDTVIDGESGFSFSGDNSVEQAQNCVKKFDEILNMHNTNPKAFQKIAKCAQAQRFSWEQVARDYIEKLYS
jgi:starch synthase